MPTTLADSPGKRIARRFAPDMRNGGRALKESQDEPARLGRESRPARSPLHSHPHPTLRRAREAPVDLHLLPKRIGTSPERDHP